MWNDIVGFMNEHSTLFGAAIGGGVAGLIVSQVYTGHIKEILKGGFDAHMEIFNRYQALVAQTVQIQLAHETTLPEFRNRKDNLANNLVMILSQIVKEAQEEKPTEEGKE